MAIDFASLTAAVAEIPTVTPVRQPRPFDTACAELNSNREKALTYFLPADPKDPTSVLTDAAVNKTLSEFRNEWNKSGEHVGCTIKKRVTVVLSKDGKSKTGLQVIVWATPRQTRKRGQ